MMLRKEEIYRLAKIIHPSQFCSRNNDAEKGRDIQVGKNNTSFDVQSICNSVVCSLFPTRSNPFSTTI
jgi:hypothetical protein